MRSWRTGNRLRCELTGKGVQSGHLVSHANNRTPQNLADFVAGTRTRGTHENTQADVFYGNIVLEVNGRSVDIDSRPSDALAIAVRTNVPILVSREVMEAASIIPEDDLEEHENGAEEPGEEPGSEVPEERLEVFEDFLENLEIDEENDDEENGKGKKKKK